MFMSLRLNAVRNVESEGLRSDRAGLSGPYAVVTAYVEATGEELPTLVQEKTWLPLPLASRWVVTTRRHRAVSTLRRDVTALLSLYGWAEGEMDDGLESRLESGGQLQLDELYQLVEAVRRLDAGDTDSDPAKPSTVRGRALGIRDFLVWALTPANRGQSGPPIGHYEKAEEVIRAAFDVLIQHRGTSERYTPLTPSEVEAVEQLIGPITDEDGLPVRPLRWNPVNPFRHGTRLRNWVMWCIAYDCGLRRGELLKLTLADLPRPTDPTAAITVRRRPNDKNDKRRIRPAVKTAERTLVISARTAAALRAYLTERPPIGRRTGQPYLFAAGHRGALGLRAANSAMDVLKSATGLEHLTWHAIRHTWAEDLAAEIYERHGSAEDALPVLRRLGGWSQTSTTPMRYIETTLERIGNQALTARNNRILGQGGARGR